MWTDVELMVCWIFFANTFSGLKEDHIFKMEIIHICIKGVVKLFAETV